MSGIRDEIRNWFLDVREEESTAEKEASKIEEISIMADVNTYIFVDLDNTSWEEVGSDVVLDEHTKISFYTDKAHATMLNSTNLNKRIKNIKASVERISSKTGPNSTDFRILCDVATVLANPGTDLVYIVSKDNDYNDAIEHLRDIYKNKIRAIEKFSSIDECISDIKLMRSTTKEEVRAQLVERLFRPYREEALYKLLDLLET